MVWAYVCVNRDGHEIISQYKPILGEDGYWKCDEFVLVPHGSIQKLIGRSMNWQDKPQELK